MTDSRPSRDDNPPFSRLFVIGSQSVSENVLQETFEPFGVIEHVFVPRERETGESKKFGYVKFTKASSAAKAMEELEGTCLKGDPKPVRIVVATAKNQSDEDPRCRDRLFVLLPKSYTEDELRSTFGVYGTVSYAKIVRDHGTNVSKGYGYIQFSKPSEAARAIENCDRSFKPLYAERRGSTKPSTSGENSESWGTVSGSGGQAFLAGAPYGDYFPTFAPFGVPVGSEDGGQVETKVRLYVVVDVSVTQSQLTKLFDLVPGMQRCILKTDRESGLSRGFAFVTYASQASAMYAKEKLHGFEYPPGYNLVVKHAEENPRGRDKDSHPPPPSSSSSSSSYLGSQAQRQSYGTSYYPSSLQYNSYVPLPAGPPPHLSSPTEIPSVVAEYKLFVNCSPGPLPLPLLKELFSQFGCLNDVCLVHGRSYGYATYSRKSAADNAIAGLHDMEVNGIKIKVTTVEGNPEETSRKRARSSAYEPDSNH